MSSDQETLEKNFKQLENQSLENQSLDIHDIYTFYESQLREVLIYWFDGKSTARYERWFGKTQKIDNEISTKFEHFLYILEKDLVDNYVIADLPQKNINFFYSLIDMFSFDQLISAIIVLDQFSRHIYRDQLDNEDRVLKNTKMAKTLSKIFFEFLGKTYSYY